jgi:hypothetical protein
VRVQDDLRAAVAALSVPAHFVVIVVLYDRVLDP